MADLVVADIGGTSSRWALVPSTGKPRVIERMPGANVAVGRTEALVNALNDHCAHDEPFRRPLRVVVYAAGCGTPERADKLKQVLQEVWPRTEIHVDHDLLGAAYGLCGTRKGLVLILGTGMNAGYFDGKAVHRPMPSLGYVLGDEGSGADLGKAYLHSALYGTVPKDIMEMLQMDKLMLEDVIAKTYSSSSPQAYLASFAATLAAHAHDPWVHQLVTTRFRELAALLERFFGSKRNSAVYATGSVAFGLQDLLGPCLAERGMVLNAVEQDPLPGLIRYHQQHWR